MKAYSAKDLQLFCKIQEYPQNYLTSTYIWYILVMMMSLAQHQHSNFDDSQELSKTAGMNMNLVMFIVDVSLAHHNYTAWTHSLDKKYFD